MFYNLIKGILNIILRITYRISVRGVENIPLEGNLILCANHASNWDPLFISIVFSRQVCWMAKKELFKNKLLSKLILKLGSFPVDRGDSDIASIKNSLRILKENGVLGIFPEGTRVKGYDSENAKPGVALLAVKSKSKVIPVYISSNYKLFNRVKINIGKPIDYISGSKKLTSEEYTEISRDILKSIYELE